MKPIKTVKLGRRRDHLYEADLLESEIEFCRTLKWKDGPTRDFFTLTYAQFAKVAKALGYVKAAPSAEV